MNGYLNVWKPSGPTSFDVVRRIRRASRVKRVGHGGTLDPAAEGVLPLLLGQATRLNEYLEDCAKVYRARVLLGTRTDTLDLQGRVLEEQDASAVSLADVLALLPGFTGVIPQTPPMFSALKHQGRRLYALARQGMEVEREARQVTVYGIDIIAWAPPRLELEVVCGRGVYIRSLAADLGDRLGCGAVLEHLARTRVGSFREDAAVGLGDAEAALLAGQGGPLIMPLEAPFAGWPALRLYPESIPQAVSGALLGPGAGEWTRVAGSAEPPFVPEPPPDRAVALGPDGQFIAVLAAEEEGLWRPRKVLAPQGEDTRRVQAPRKET